MNYRSFGFTKIVPRLSAEKFGDIVSTSASANEAVPLWEKVRSQSSSYFTRIEALAIQLKDYIYATEPDTILTIGKRSDGHVCNYYMGEPITDAEVTAIQATAEQEKIEALNTR